MDALSFSFLSALSPPERSDSGDRRIYVIVPRTQAYLADLLTKAFEGRGDIEVLVDRRRGERRAQPKVVSSDRRRADRRRMAEGTVQVVITNAGKPG
jgi:hypothetical protein